MPGDLHGRAAPRPAAAAFVHAARSAAPRREERRRADDLDFGDGPAVRPHRGGALLTLGLLGLLFACCPLLGWTLGGYAISRANEDLAMMAVRRMDRAGEGLTQAGKVCGILAVAVASLVALVFFFRVIAD